MNSDKSKKCIKNKDEKIHFNMELQYKLPRPGIDDSTRRVQLRGLHSVSHVVVMGCLRVLLLGWGEGVLLSDSYMESLTVDHSG